MNEQPNNIISIEKGREIKINAIENLKIEVEKNLTELGLLLTEASERYEVAQKFGSEEEISRLFDIIFHTEESIKQQEKILGEVNEKLHTLIGRSSERGSVAQERHFTELTTEQGSIYLSLPDGRTQRFKKATDELHEPQDVLVFIPPYKLIGATVVGHYPEIFKGVTNEDQFMQVLLKHVHSSGYTSRIVSNKGIELKKNQDVSNAERVFLHFISRSNPNDNFLLPVSKEPKLGYSTYDTRVYLDERGKNVRDRHLGNKIVDIKY